MRQGGLISADYGKKSNDKKHDVPLGGIVGGIKTEIDLTKTTFFATAASRLVSTEILIDKESGTRKETINSTTNGNRIIEDDASSSYYGGILDFRFFGVSYSHADFDYLNEFRVGETPNLTARDENGY